MANVYIPLFETARGKMHTRFNCPGIPEARIYVPEEIAREVHGVTEFCKRCNKPKTRKGVAHATKNRPVWA